VGYSDSDWVRDINDRKSVMGFVFYIGDTSFTWNSSKQSIIILLICEAEYVVNTLCVYHFIWLRRLLKELWMLQEKPFIWTTAKTSKPH